MQTSDFHLDRQTHLAPTIFIARSGLTMTRHDVWKALAGARKAKQPVRKKRARERKSTLFED